MYLFWIMELVLGGAGAWFVSRFAHRLGLIDAPSERSSHILPTPKGGGVGILCAFVIGCVFLDLSIAFCLSVTFLSFISLMGDRFHLSPSIRLALQFVVAFIVISCLPVFQFGHPSDSLAPADSSYAFVISMLGLVVVAVFIVGTANYYNFMDGINGIAGITGVVGFGLLAWYGLSCGKDSTYLMLSVGLVMACLGFLPFNLPKAKVFMGDVGSILLGFVFAVIVILFANTVTEFIVLACFLFPFYADELVTMVERLRMGQSLTTPHRRHLYQVLANEAGIAHWKVSLGYGLLQLVIGVSVWQCARFGLGPALVVVLLFGGLFVMTNIGVKRKLMAP